MRFHRTVDDYFDRPQAVLVPVQAVLACAAGDGGRQRAGATLPVGACAQCGIGKADGRRLGPGKVSARSGNLPDEVGRTGAGRRDAHGRKSLNYLKLLMGKALVNAQFAPAPQVHTGRVEEGGNPHPGSLLDPLAQKVEAGRAEVPVADPSHLDALHRHQLVGAVYLAQRNHDLDGPLHAGTVGAIQHGAFFGRQSHGLAASSRLPAIVPTNTLPAPPSAECLESVGVAIGRPRPLAGAELPVARIAQARDDVPDIIQPLVNGSQVDGHVGVG
jgi:hypothetical protein